MSGVFALIPAKEPALGKSRLACILPDSERCALNHLLARRTLECCIGVFGAGRTVLVTTAQVLAEEARSLGIEVVRDGNADGLNAALALAAARAERSIVARCDNLSSDPTRVPRGSRPSQRGHEPARTCAAARRGIRIRRAQPRKAS